MPKDLKSKRVEEHFIWAHIFTENINSKIFKEDLLNPGEYFKYVKDAHVHFTGRVILVFLYSNLTSGHGGCSRAITPTGKTDRTCSQVLFPVLKHLSVLKTTTDK